MNDRAEKTDSRAGHGLPALSDAADLLRLIHEGEGMNAMSAYVLGVQWEAGYQMADRAKGSRMMSEAEKGNRWPTRRGQ